MNTINTQKITQTHINSETNRILATYSEDYYGDVDIKALRLLGLRK